MTFNSFMDGWRRDILMNVFGDSCGTVEGHGTEEATRPYVRAKPVRGLLAEATIPSMKQERNSGSGYRVPPAGIHTGRTIEDLVEQVSRRVDALPRVLAKQEQRRKEIQEELSK